MLTDIKRDAVILLDGELDKDAAIEMLVKVSGAAYGVGSWEEILSLIIERESRLSTGIGLEVAVPHCRCGHVAGLVSGVMLAPRGIDYNAVDSLPVKLLFLVVSPIGDIGSHLGALSAISRAVSIEEVRLDLLGSGSADELYEKIIAV